jgi:uncharacterized RDD family membrane protein YckC
MASVGDSNVTGMTNQTDYSVFTPERVNLQYDIAGIGSRAAAALVDSVIQFVLFFALLFAMGVQSDQLERLGLVLPEWLPMLLVVLGLFFLLWGYYLIFEIVWSGQTPGKRVLSLRVIRENGYPLRPVDGVIRNLIRIVDAPPFGFAIGAIAMLLNDRAKRLGDFAAGTIVVREARRRSFQQVIAGAPNGPQVAGGAGSTVPAAAAPAALDSSAAGTTQVRLTLAAEESSLVRDFLVRRQLMDRAARAVMARQLAEHLAQRYGLQAQRPESDEAFLESLVNA